MTTIHDVSRAAGVSTATVSRVVNHPERVDPKTRERVEVVITQLKYRPNQIARGLARKSSRTVGIVINMFGSAYYGNMLDGAVAALRRMKFHAIVESSLESSDGERQALESLLARQCESVILHSDALSDAELGRLMTEHPNTILMNRCLPGFETRCAYVDNQEGGRQAARYLIDRGHRRIAMVTGPAHYHEVQNRSAGFLEIMQAEQLSMDEELIIRCDFRAAGGATAMQQLLDIDTRPTAVFFQNDEMVAGAMDVCRERNVKVPDELSLVGFDNVSTAHYLTPKLTTVAQPLFRIGEASALMAHALAKKQPIPKDLQQRIFLPRIIERDSTMDCADRIC